eukprot:8045627-Prorocentrum_lima.AAC.1
MVQVHDIKTTVPGRWDKAEDESDVRDGLHHDVPGALPQQGWETSWATYLEQPHYACTYAGTSGSLHMSEATDSN